MIGENSLIEKSLNGLAKGVLMYDYNSSTQNEQSLLEFNQGFTKNIMKELNPIELIPFE